MKLVASASPDGYDNGNLIRNRITMSQMDPNLWALAALGAVLLLLLLSVLVGRNPKTDADGGWGRGTRYFLVLLRLAIGWHFLIEGIDKLQSDTWSSEAYLRESVGPLAPHFRKLAGDTLLERLTVTSGNFPTLLDAEWNSYFEHFKSYHGLDGEQTNQARKKLDEARAKMLAWLTTEKKVIRKFSPYPPPLEAAMTVPERVKLYQEWEAKVRQIEEKDLNEIGRGAFGKLKEARAEVNRIRAELRSELAMHTAAFKRSLQDVLTTEQKDKAAMKGPGKPIGDWTTLDWSDAVVKYGLVAVGGLLLLGLLTRTACVAGALFLLMFYLAMPALPDWPEPARVEGHYLYINKTIIEMLALLVLATTRSGRWCGIDGLLQLFRADPDAQAARGSYHLSGAPRHDIAS